MGAGWRRDAQARLETGVRISALRLGGLQRGDRALRAGAGLADPSARRRLLSRVDGNLSVGEFVRLRFSVWRTSVRAPVLTCMDRFSRNQGSLHARKALRLFREQPAC